MKIFLSYPSERLTQAREIYAFLVSLGLNVWFDKESLVAGQDWEREIGKAQRNAELIVQICSVEVVNKTGIIQREIRNTLQLLELRPLDSLYLICLKTEDVQLPSELMKFQHIDFFEERWKSHLVRALELKFRQLNSQPPHEFKNYVNSTNTTTRDPILLEFREETPDLDLSAQYIQYIIEDDYWKYINAEVIQDIFGRIYDIRGAFEDTQKSGVSAQKSSGSL
jgi:hypothetical protein